MKKPWLKIGLVLLGLIALIVIGFIIWASNPAQPEPQALNSMTSNHSVDYKLINDWLVFSATNESLSTGLILYPGARVDPRAYASHAAAIASEGFTVIIVPMPLNFAFLGINRAHTVMQSFPDIQYWAVGGHSLGGAMAAEFASANPSSVEALVLWASYTAESNDLSASGLSALVVYASNDGLATIEDIDASRPRLPTDTILVIIEGGNHAGFGYYGSQRGDGEAEISKIAQEEQIVQATVDFLSTVAE